MSNSDNDIVCSPCVAICALDADDICVGCYRSGEEISEWGAMKAPERRKVLANVREREKASGNVMA